MTKDDEWVNVKERMPPDSDVIKVRRQNGEELTAYYHHDEVAWVKFYGTKTSHWQCKKTHEFLFDVTHWRCCTNCSN